MTTLTIAFRSLARRRLRTVLTLLSIALPMLVYTGARSIVDDVRRFIAEVDRNGRVVVHQRFGYTTTLPQRLREDILALDHRGSVRAVCRTTWFGGHVEDAQVAFPSMAVDRDTFPIVYDEYGFSPDDLRRLAAERRAAVVGRPLAARMNWKIGDVIVLVGGLPPYPRMEFIVAAIPSRLETSWLYVGLDYYDEVYREKAGEPVGVNTFWLKCTSAEARRWALTEIDRHFANSEHETRTEMESTFLLSFARTEGAWVDLIWTVGQLIVLVSVAAAFNTLSQSIRERTRDLAVLRALGFSRARIMGMVLLEGLSFGLLGGLLGVMPVYLVSAVVSPVLPGSSAPLHISGWTSVVGIATGLAVGALAAVLPAASASRLKVAAALGRVV
ncbi:MAG TPA: FtsX-like permease family protein [Phycisphaerae bacterium]|jgi:putative ABC transport system permease protein